MDTSYIENVEHIAKIEAESKLSIEINKLKKLRKRNSTMVIDADSFINPLVDHLYRKLVF
jgi:hypothetical protein